MTIKPACGWREWVSLPDLEIRGIKAKIDTGARTSAIHARHIKTYTRHGHTYVSFCVYPTQRSNKDAVWCRAPLIDERDVRNSGGKAESRYVVRTTLKMGGDTWPIELTLTQRDNMGFRMLLGRTAVRDRVLVDAGRSYLIGKKPAQKNLKGAHKHKHKHKHKEGKTGDAS